MLTSLSVVIPAYNEEANVDKCLRSVHGVLKELKIDWEIILVNDGSLDKTGDIAHKLVRKIPNLKVIDNNPNRGYGGSLKAGFAAATKEFIAFVPADNQFDFREIKKFLKKQEETDADIVSGIRVHDTDPVHRKLNRWGWNTLVRAMFGYLATDVDCGFKLLRRSILEKISMPSEGAMVDTQLFAGARVRNMKIAEIPVTHLPRTAGKSTGANIRVIIRAFRDLFRFWWQLRQEVMVERGKVVFRWEFLLILAILILAMVLRLYRIDEYLVFLGDEGRDVMVVRDMLLGKKFTLIGPGTSIGNMYLGPLYYYLMIIPLALFGLSPVGPAVMVAIFGVATVALMWWVGRQWYGRSEALIISLLYAISPTVITYSRSSWNPNIMPFFALLAVYSIWKVWKYGYWRWFVICAVSLAFVLNSHYLGLLILPVIILFWLLSSKDKSAWKYTLMGGAGFLILMSPLLLFDMRHDWTNFNAISKFFSERQTTVNLKPYKAIPHLWPLWEQVSGSMIAAKDATVSRILALVVALLVAIRLYKNDRKNLLFLLVWLVTGLVGLGLYKQHIYDHYFGFIYPAVFLLLGFALQLFWKNKLMKIISLLIIIFLAGLNITNSPLRWQPNNQMTRTRQISDFIVRESGGQKFHLALISDHNYDMSYRYFLPPVESNYQTIHEGVVDQLFVICENAECEPIGHPLWEIAAFGWAKVEREWVFPWGTRLYKLVHNPSGQPEQ